MWQNLISYYPNADAGGGSAPDGATEKPADAGNNADQDKAEAKRLDKLLRQAQAELKTIKDKQAEDSRKQLEDQGKFKEVNESLTKERESLMAKIAQLEAFQKQVMDSHQAELDELLKGLSDEDKATVELGIDLAAKIKLAKRFATQKPPANGGPPVVPGRRSTDLTDDQRYAEARKMRSTHDAMTLLTKGTKK